MALALRTRTPGARALLPATRSRASGQLGALLSSPVLGVRLMTALQVLQILQQNSLAQHWARDWRALALTQVHHGSRLSDSREDGEALSSVHSTALAAGKLIHNLLCDGRVKND